jgi:hypothetical protein
MFSADGQDLASTLTRTQEALESGGFSVVGDYSPYADARVLVITHPALLAAAAEHEFGAYGAVLRVGVTQIESGIQVAAANPAYWGLAFHIGELTDVEAALTAALGEGEGFGSKRGLTAKSLAKYRYMLMMPRLRDHDELAEFDSHAAALAAIRAGLAASEDLTAVFEVAVPGRDEVLFGVAIGSGDGGDATVMQTTDQGEKRHTPHLPYGLLVSGDTAYALAGKFRIALAFPDLGMGTFMKISGAPDAIRDALASLAESAD